MFAKANSGKLLEVLYLFMVNAKTSINIKVFATQFSRVDVDDLWKMFINMRRINSCWKPITTICFDYWLSLPVNTQRWFNDDICWNDVATLDDVISTLNGRHLVNADLTLNSTMKQHRLWVDTKNSFGDNLQGLLNHNIHILG